MKKSKVPVVFGEHTRPTKPLNADSLKTTGQPFANYGITVGETIEFPDTWDDVDAREQPIREGSTNMQRILLVDRIDKNGNRKASWLSLGILNRTDYNREPTCAFCAEMNELESDHARIEKLLGKRITCKSMIKKEFQAFDRQTGLRLVGQTDTRETPVITYAE